MRPDGRKTAFFPGKRELRFLDSRRGVLFQQSADMLMKDGCFLVYTAALLLLGVLVITSKSEGAYKSCSRRIAQQFSVCPSDIFGLTRRKQKRTFLSFFLPAFQGITASVSGKMYMSREYFFANTVCKQTRVVGRLQPHICFCGIPDLLAQFYPYSQFHPSQSQFYPPQFQPDRCFLSLVKLSANDDSDATTGK